MAKTKTRRRRKLKQLQLLQTKQQYNSKDWISPTEAPGGVFIGTRGNGARGTTPGPKLGRARPHGRENAA